MPIARFQSAVLPSVALLLLAACASSAAAQSTLSGRVVDTGGVAQMGALVEVLSSPSHVLASAFTDPEGRYMLRNLPAGSYAVRATATLFVPATRSGVRLRTGAGVVANLTLAGVFDVASWLPAARRQREEPTDDWRWTLRSAANRPILRLAEESSPGARRGAGPETPRPRTASITEARVTTGASLFGAGGVSHQVRSERTVGQSSDLLLDAELRSFSPTASQGQHAGARVTSAWRRTEGDGSGSIVAASFASHPEIHTGRGGPSLEQVRLSGAHRSQFGDFAELEAGSSLLLARAEGAVVETRPFLRIEAHPAAGWSLGYRMATSPEIQGYDDIVAGRGDPLPAGTAQGKLRFQRTAHHELSASRAVGRGSLRVAYYSDHSDSQMISGVLPPGNGTFPPGLEQEPGVLLDSSTGAFRLLGPGQQADGWNLLFTEPLSPGLWVAVEYTSGAGLVRGAPERGLVQLNGAARRRSEAASVAVKGDLTATGTRFRAVYHWQPEDMLTPVDPYAAFGRDAYLTVQLRQRVHCRGLLPPGTELRFNGINLLAQGYTPVSGGAGEAMVLAATPRSLRAGLGFTF